MGVLVHIFDVEPIFQHYGAGGSIDVTLSQPDISKIAHELH